MSKEVYFAKDEAKKCISYLEEKSNAWYNNIQTNRYLEKMLTSWAYYYGQFYDESHQISFGGESGELVNFPIAHFGNIGRHVLNTVTGSRPSFQCRAVNTDRKSMLQAELGNSILNYYMREARYERKLKKAAEYSIVMGTGYILTEWNSTKGGLAGEIAIDEELIASYDEDGRPLDEEGNLLEPTPIFRGDIESRALSPLDVVFDFTKDDPELNDWYLVRTFMNKFDLAAKYPEYAEELTKMGTSAGTKKRISLSPFDESCDIPVYQFFHRETEALPKGRYLFYVNDDIILDDIALPYPSLPIQRIAPYDILGSSFGYTTMFDLIPIQDAVNSVYSTILTNHHAFGVQNILNPIGNNVKFTQVSGGLNWIEYDKEYGSPAALQLTKSSPESYNLIGTLEKVMETVSGINSVARGNPEPSLKSGTALALIQAQALQFMSGLQQNYIQLLEDSGTFIINLLKEFADEPRVVAIAGISNTNRMQQFNNDDIVSINRVVVDVGNALMQCLSKGTEVLMYDGSLKKVEDVEVGDLVMGDNSQPKTVSVTGKGVEEMYEIVTTKGEVIYSCNESHIMTLRYCSDDRRYNAKKGQVIDISVKDYLKLTNSHQRILMGFRTGVEFEKKELSVDPYILGTWLGDGDTCRTSLTTKDLELVKVWEDYADELGMECNTVEKNGTLRIGIVSGQNSGRADRNVFTNKLKDLSLLNNKHIPSDYLTSDRNDRLELLAGLLDTDGTLADGTCFVFYQKDLEIAKKVQFLSRSLGFKATLVTSERETNYSNGKKAILSKVFISGDTHLIPTRIPRKKARKIENRRSNPMNYGFTLRAIGEDTYYGFTLKESPRFVLADCTVTHNSHAGRWQVAENLIQMGLIKTPEKVLEILNTGNLETVTKGTTDELDVIRAENEALLKDNPVIAISIDHHAMHIREHRDVLSDPVLRQDADLVKRTLAHIQEHIVLLRETDPALLAIYGEQPIGPVAGSPPAPNQGENIPQTDMGETMQQAEPQQSIAGMPEPAQPPGEFENLPQTPQELMASQG